MIPLSEPGATIRNLVIRETKNTLRDLSPGATYELQLYTVFENKESQVIYPLQIFLHRYYKYFYCRPTSRPTSRRSPTPRGGSSSGSVTRQRCSCCGSRPSRPATTPTTRCVDIHVYIYGWLSTISTQASIWPEDAVLSETYVPKDVDHPGTPAQVSLVTSATSSSIFLSYPCLVCIFCVLTWWVVRSQ